MRPSVRDFVRWNRIAVTPLIRRSPAVLNATKDPLSDRLDRCQQLPRSINLGRAARSHASPPFDHSRCAELTQARARCACSSILHGAQASVLPKRKFRQGDRSDEGCAVDTKYVSAAGHLFHHVTLGRMHVGRTREDRFSSNSRYGGKPLCTFLTYTVTVNSSHVVLCCCTRVPKLELDILPRN